jgi:Fuc2NAc and GlcNAc transferase
MFGFSLIFLLCAVFASAVAMTRGIRIYALKRLVDVPNERSSHATPTPRGGGLAIVLSFYGGCVACALVGWISPMSLLILSSGAIVAGIGFIDDHRDVSPLLRLLAHVLAGLAALILLNGMPELPLGYSRLYVAQFGVLLGLLWLVWQLNLFNFMDGIDAIAGMEVIFVGIAAVGLMLSSAVYNLETVVGLAILAAASGGFLVWNWPPARIFMGDVGSGFVGYTLALIALADMRTGPGGLSLPVWLILSGLFFTDATYTLCRRVVTGQRWHLAHRSHAYQKATALFGGHRPVVLYCLLINAFWLLPNAIAAHVWPAFGFPILLIALLPLLAIAVLLRAGDP